MQPQLLALFAVLASLATCAISGCRTSAHPPGVTQCDGGRFGYRATRDTGDTDVTRVVGYDLSYAIFPICKNLTREGVGHLLASNSVHSLELDGCSSVALSVITDITKETELVRLGMSGLQQQLSDADIDALAPLCRLRVLGISSANITDEGVVAIIHLFPELEELDLRYCHRVTAEGLLQLAGCPKLRKLWVSLELLPDEDAERARRGLQHVLIP